MGRRKSRKAPVATRTREKLATTFNCLFCQEEGAVRVQIKKVDEPKKPRLAELACSGCGLKWNTSCGPLQQPIDIYSAWVDACDQRSGEVDGEADQDSGREEDEEEEEEEDIDAEEEDEDESDSARYRRRSSSSSSSSSSRASSSKQRRREPEISSEDDLDLGHLPKGPSGDPDELDDSD